MKRQAHLIIWIAMVAAMIQSVFAGYPNNMKDDTISSVVRLRQMIDADNRTNSIGYHATFTSQINQVTSHYGNVATLNYDGAGKLINTVNVGGLINSFGYDSQTLITNLTTVFGTTSFKASTNAFAPYNLGGTNQVNRSVEVTQADGGKQLFLYRDQSTKLFPGSSTDLIPAAYPSGEVPNTSPYGNTFDNSAVDARNSFHWNQKQYASLSSSYRTTGILTNLTLADYKISRMQHWLRGYNNSAVVTESLGLVRSASPDGTIDGQKSWLDYSGKLGGNGTRGTNAAPLFTALVLPDATSRYSYSQRNKWEKPTQIISTYGTGIPGTRAHNFTYTTDGLDVIEVRGPSTELISSNSYNGFHQVTTHFNAANDKTVFTYDTSHRLTGIQFPGGLVATNFYFTSGTHTGWLDRTIDYEGSLSTSIRTNSFTYSNGLIATQTDPRALVTTRNWDNLRRPTTLVIPAGTYTNQYINLSLSNVFNPLGNSVRFKYEILGRTTNVTDSAGTTGACHELGLLLCLTNAVAQKTVFSYDFNGNLLTTTFPDLTVSTARYNLLGQLTNAVNAAAASITNWYNNQGLLISSSNAFGQLAASSYDLRDRITVSTNAHGGILTNTYDNASRVVARSYPDGGIERFQYSALGLITYTNQIGKITRFGYDASGRKIAETNANNEVIRYTYSPAGDLLTLTDGRSKVTQWAYDQYGQVTNKIDANGTTVLRFKYDAAGRLTNRWSLGKGDTFYRYDQANSLTNVDYSLSTDLTFAYDAAKRLTNMVDAAGTSQFSFNNMSSLLTEDGPWANDTISYGYQNTQLRSSLSLLQPNGPAWTQAYGYDTASRLQTITSSPGTFTYSYQGAGGLVKKLAFPSGAYITNAFDPVFRVQSTALKASGNYTINSHDYLHNTAGQRTKQTRSEGSYVDYTYDDIGQLRTAVGKESAGTPRLNENFAYGYDAGGNLNSRTNNALTQAFTVDGINQLTNITRASTLTVAGTSSSAATSVTVNGLAAARYADSTFAKEGFSLADGNNTFTAVAQDSLGRLDTNSVTINLPAAVKPLYDGNGNMTSDGRRGFAYDDENQLTSITVTNNWKTEFKYDGLGRRRTRKEFQWANSQFLTVSETRYVCDGNLVVQERDINNTPLVSYTRGKDLSGSLQGAGGIGGLLSRTDQSSLTPSHAFYQSDANGNVTALINDKQIIVARYVYDPYGNPISKSGPLAEVNLYRFSSKELHANSGLIYYGFRFYEPNLQRWLNADPIGEAGGMNLHGFVGNNGVNAIDPWGTISLKPQQPVLVKVTEMVLQRIIGEMFLLSPALFGLKNGTLFPSGGTEFIAAYLLGRTGTDPDAPSARPGFTTLELLNEELGQFMGTFDNPDTGAQMTGGETIRYIGKELAKQALFEGSTYYFGIKISK